MWDAMVDLFFIQVRLRVRLANALGDHVPVAFCVACILAVLALHAGRVLEEVSAQSAAHDIVELNLDEFVAEHLVHFLLALSNGTLAPQAFHFERVLVPVVLYERQVEPDLTCRLEVEPGIYWGARGRYDRCTRGRLWR